LRPPRTSITLTAYYERKHVHIAFGLGGHDLLRLDVLERGELIAQPRGPLEFEPARRVLHSRAELRIEIDASALEYLDRARDILGIVLA
jgi:hypothetical protein